MRLLPNGTAMILECACWQRVSLVALIGLIAAEAIAMATLVQPIAMAQGGHVCLLAAGMLVLVALYTIFSGNSGVMQCVQLQLGMVYLGLFGSLALLLYVLVSDVIPMPPHGKFAVLFIAAACIFVLFYRSSKYVDTTPIRSANSGSGDVAAGASFPVGARLLSRLEKILNPSISVIVVLVLVLTAMEFFSASVPGHDARQHCGAANGNRNFWHDAAGDRVSFPALSHC